MNIRQANSGDVVRLAQLLGELGYPATPVEVSERIARLNEQASDSVMVCEDGGEVIGCISLHIVPLFHLSSSMGRITALVVNEHQRSRGIGAKLLGAAHAWFDACGCAYYEVTCGDQRVRAHQFYKTHGYVKKSVRFLRDAKHFPHP